MNGEDPFRSRVYIEHCCKIGGMVPSYLELVMIEGRLRQRKTIGTPFDGFTIKYCPYCGQKIKLREDIMNEKLLEEL